MGANDDIIRIAHRIRPDVVCLVPERRQEVTTEGGLDVAGQQARLTEVVGGFNADGIEVSMFIDPDRDQVDASKAVGATYVELHTGAYADAKGAKVDNEFRRIENAGLYAQDVGLIFNAGHGLSVRNLAPIAAIPGLHEVNIGHDIIARAIFIGLENAVQEILDILEMHSV
jgi:pyridoxine 5-phosphate synthase